MNRFYLLMIILAKLTMACSDNQLLKTANGKQELYARSENATVNYPKITLSDLWKLNPNAKNSFRGEGLVADLEVMIDGISIEVEIQSEAKAHLTLPNEFSLGRKQVQILYKGVLIAETETIIIPEDGLYMYMEMDPALVCSDINYINEEGNMIKGIRDCDASFEDKRLEEKDKIIAEKEKGLSVCLTEQNSIVTELEAAKNKILELTQDKIDCTTAGQVGCLTTSSYPSMDAASESALSVSLTSTNFHASLSSSSDLEFWDRSGKRHIVQGDSDLVAENILSEVDLFGISGSVDQVNYEECTLSGQLGCITTDDIQSFDLLKFSKNAPYILSGLELLGVSGSFSSYPEDAEFTQTEKYFPLGLNDIELSWLDKNAHGYLVVKTTDSALTWAPEHSQLYSTETIDENHEIIYVGNELGVVDEDILIGGSNTYTYHIYSYDSNLIYSPIAGKFEPAYAEGVLAAEWRVKLNSIDNGNYAEIWEIEFKKEGQWQSNAAISFTEGTIAGVNFNQISSSSSYRATDWIAVGAFENSLMQGARTSWATASGTFSSQAPYDAIGEEWIAVDFGVENAQPIEGMRLYPECNDSPDDFEIQYKDQNGDWVTIPEGSISNNSICNDWVEIHW